MDDEKNDPRRNNSKRIGGQVSMLDLLDQLAKKEHSLSELAYSTVPGAESLYKRLKILRPKIEAYPNSLVVRTKLPRISSKVQQAHDLWLQRAKRPDLPEGQRAFALLVVAQHITEATHSCDELEAHLSDRLPVEGEMGRALYAMHKTRDILARGWCQGAEARKTNSAESVSIKSADAGRWSLMGALRLACGSNRPVLAASQGLICEALGIMPWSLEQWNDDEERTYGEVLLAVEHGIFRANQWARGNSKPPPTTPPETES